MRQWPPELVKRLTECWANGESGGRIAALLGVTRNSVIGKVHRLGLPKRKTVETAPSARYWRTGRGIARPRAVFDHQPEEGTEVILELVPIQKPVRLVAVPTEAPPSLKVPLLDLQGQHCRWPGDDSPLTTFCGQDRLENSSYCGFHDKLSRGTGTPSERRAADWRR